MVWLALFAIFFGGAPLYADCAERVAFAKSKLGVLVEAPESWANLDDPEISLLTRLYFESLAAVDVSEAGKKSYAAFRSEPVPVVEKDPASVETYLPAPVLGYYRNLRGQLEILGGGIKILARPAGIFGRVPLDTLEGGFDVDQKGAPWIFLPEGRYAGAVVVHESSHFTDWLTVRERIKAQVSLSAEDYSQLAFLLTVVRPERLTASEARAQIRTLDYFFDYLPHELEDHEGLLHLANYPLLEGIARVLFFQEKLQSKETIFSEEQKLLLPSLQDQFGRQLKLYSRILKEQTSELREIARRDHESLALHRWRSGRLLGWLRHKSQALYFGREPVFPNAYFDDFPYLQFEKAFQALLSF